MTPADKTSNTYRLTKERYEQLIMKSLTCIYKKAKSNIKEKLTCPRKI